MSWFVKCTYIVYLTLLHFLCVCFVKNQAAEALINVNSGHGSHNIQFPIRHHACQLQFCWSCNFLESKPIAGDGLV
jgi:hypothetical protein